MKKVTYQRNKERKKERNTQIKKKGINENERGKK